MVLKHSATDRGTRKTRSGHEPLAGGKLVTMSLCDCSSTEPADAVTDFLGTVVARVVKQRESRADTGAGMITAQIDQIHTRSLILGLRVPNIVPRRRPIVASSTATTWHYVFLVSAAQQSPKLKNTIWNRETRKGEL